MKWEKNKNKKLRWSAFAFPFSPASLEICTRFGNSRFSFCNIFFQFQFSKKCEYGIEFDAFPQFEKILHAPLVSSQVFDPDVWSWNSAPESSLDLPIDSSPNFSMPPATSSETEFAENEESTSSSDDKKKRSEVIEENRSDGHAPIKSALSILMRSLQKSSSMTTSLSDIDVTLFNFHSTKFAERLLNRNVSSVVIVESSHVFSKNAKLTVSYRRCHQSFEKMMPRCDASDPTIYLLVFVEESEMILNI
nr:hypothetical protein C50E3.5 - Caenorhabditis elegans [Caenorhabditis elegans]